MSEKTLQTEAVIGYFQIHNAIKERLEKLVEMRSTLTYNDESFTITGYEVQSNGEISVTLETHSYCRGTEWYEMSFAEDYFYEDSSTFRELEEQVKAKKLEKEENKKQEEAKNRQKQEAEEREQLRKLQEKYGFKP